MSDDIACTDLDFKYGVKIYTLGDKVLEELCQEVPQEELQSLKVQNAVSDAHLALTKFRMANGFGRAIAAPQVGHAIRMIAMNLNNKKYTIFNPIITQRSSETFTMWDDCLSFPDLMASVQRHKSVSVRFIDEDGTTVVWENCDQALSELLQHEIDHLDGILAVNKAISPPKNGLGGLTVKPVVARKEWLENRELYNALVDYSI